MTPRLELLAPVAFVPVDSGLAVPRSAKEGKAIDSSTTRARARERARARRRRPLTTTMPP
jgi:hypothetical protein